ncbi:NAD(+) kinase [Buchnera aphidicola]|uniref:NAD(+) kinase n=1 Tax=Buchnera aphidicola TaxID=9 RepID=UPI0034642618
MSNEKNMQWISILGYPRQKSSFLTHKTLYDWLIHQGYNVVTEYNIAKTLNLKKIHVLKLDEIGQKCDLAIVVGGDGNLLRIARKLSYYSIKIIGVNRGNLGFLTDLNPNNVIVMLSKILDGEYFLEKRFLLELNIFKKRTGGIKKIIVVNECILHPEKISNMIEFEVYINKKIAFSQRSDGLIISTPTGSTGYSLSAGGPILSTLLDAILLVPMFPHTLSSRPIVLDGNSIIMLKVFNFEKKIKITCDGQTIFSISRGDKIIIRKSKYCLNLIHPKSYSYFQVLNSKLNWSKKLF